MPVPGYAGSKVVNLVSSGAGTNSTNASKMKISQWDCADFYLTILQSQKMNFYAIQRTISYKTTIQFNKALLYIALPNSTKILSYKHYTILQNIIVHPHIHYSNAMNRIDKQCNSISNGTQYEWNFNTGCNPLHLPQEIHNQVWVFRLFQQRILAFYKVTKKWNLPSFTPYTESFGQFLQIIISRSKLSTPSLDHRKLVITPAMLKILSVSIWDPTIPRIWHAKKATWGN